MILIRLRRSRSMSPSVHAACTIGARSCDTTNIVRRMPCMRTRRARLVQLVLDGSDARRAHARCRAEDDRCGVRAVQPDEVVGDRDDVVGLRGTCEVVPAGEARPPLLDRDPPHARTVPGVSGHTRALPMAAAAPPRRDRAVGRGAGDERRRGARECGEDHTEQTRCLVLRPGGGGPMTMISVAGVSAAMGVRFPASTVPPPVYGSVPLAPPRPPRRDVRPRPDPRGGPVNPMLIDQCPAAPARRFGRRPPLHHAARRGVQPRPGSARPAARARGARWPRRSRR